MPTPDCMAEPLLSFVVPTHNTLGLTTACVASVLRMEAGPCEVVVVDDGSRDGTTEALGVRFPEVRVVQHERALGFTAAANRGVAETRGDLVVLLNSDTALREGGATAIREAFDRSPELGVVGARLVYPDGSTQWSGGAEPSLLWLFVLASGMTRLLGGLGSIRRLRRWATEDEIEVDWVTGAALGFRREVWRDAGPLDTDFRFYCQDLAFCIRARGAGWQVAIVPRFEVVHHHGATIRRESGASGKQNPRLLWTDLLRWAARYRRSRWARWAATALIAGGRMRLLGRSLGRLLRRAGARELWDRDTLSYRQALTALREARRDL